MARKGATYIHEKGMALLMTSKMPISVVSPNIAALESVVGAFPEEVTGCLLLAVN